MTDHELLSRYARENSQAAFAELVARHVNLVYSAARRQVRAPQLAEDITQSVFLDLARHAEELSSIQPLAAWLHVVTRRTAIDVIRRETRRTAREQTAVELAATAAMPSSSPSAWSQLEPLLDEAVAALPESDRTAILLRFFENKSLREIGESLGTSDDAAQKRVSRALDQLRTVLLRRGLTITAATLATDLSAHAILTAPVALTGAIATSAAALSIATAATSTAVKTVLMTTLQKSLVTAALVITAGAGLYEVSVVYRQGAELAQLQTRSAALLADLDRTRAEHVAAARRLAIVEAQIDARLAAARPPAPGSDAALEAQIQTWLAHLDRLKQLIVQRTDLAIPELLFLSADDWASLASQTASAPGLDTESGLRGSLAILRQRAENLMAMKLQRALNTYLKSAGGVLPDSIAQLLPHFDPSISPELLLRYELLRTGKLADISVNDRSTGIIATKSIVDLDQDFLWRIGTGGFTSISAMSFLVSEAQRQFGQANGGQRATLPEQLTPYLKWPVDPAKLQKFLVPRRPAAVPTP